MTRENPWDLVVADNAGPLTSSTQMPTPIGHQPENFQGLGKRPGGLGALDFGREVRSLGKFLGVIGGVRPVFHPDFSGILGLIFSSVPGP